VGSGIAMTRKNRILFARRSGDAVRGVLGVVGKSWEGFGVWNLLH
jgi:hypothetical protein